MSSSNSTSIKGAIAAAIQKRLQAPDFTKTNASIPAKRKQSQSEVIDLTDDDPTEVKRPRMAAQCDRGQAKTPPALSLSVISPTYESPKSPVETPTTANKADAPDKRTTPQRQLPALRLTTADHAYPDYALGPARLRTSAKSPETPYKPTSSTFLTPHGHTPVSPAYSPTSPQYPGPPAEKELPATNPVSGEPLSGSIEESAATPAPLNQLPTPNPTPQKNSKLHSVPEIADRYIANTSTIEGIEYSNPQKFTLKPAFWNKWSGTTYMRLAEHLREQFNPAPFAVNNNLSIDEVKHVFNALVCNPLYFVVEARKRGESGMKEIIELYNQYGTPTRPWGVAEEKVEGELSGVAAGSVQLILQNGSKRSMKLADMSKVDIKYLKDTLTMEDKCILWESHGEMRGYGPDGLIL